VIVVKKIMATTKQKRVAKLIIENTLLDTPLTGGEIVENSGYGESMKLYPKRVIDTEGVTQALAEYGFTEDNAKRVVTDILLNEDERAETRLKASDMVFKVHGTYAPEKSTAVNVNVDARLEDKDGLNAIREEFENKLKARLVQ
jgi:hypothetical protein